LLITIDSLLLTTRPDNNARDNHLTDALNLGAAWLGSRLAAYRHRLNDQLVSYQSSDWANATPIAPIFLFNVG